MNFSRLAVSRVRVPVMATRSMSTSRPSINIAIAGATGAVGQELLELLEERNFPVKSLKLLASARSAGKKIPFIGKELTVEELTEDSFDDVDIAFFSAGGSQSRKFGPVAGKKSCLVIDNSSAFRMDPACPLVVPEVNADAIPDAKESMIIANPNCSTIIMNTVVWPIHQKAKCKRVVVSTYQAASGAGAQAMAELEQQAKDWVKGDAITQDIFGRQYIWNLFSHNSDIDPETGYNEEELKMVKETKKIFSEPDIAVTATCIRVPVLRAHCEAINLELESSVSEEEVKEILAKAPGVELADNRADNAFPEPLDASGKDDILVGRIRSDVSQPKGQGIEMFVAGDQIRKGAALNAVQIAEEVLDNYRELLKKI
eukprot:CAMPEP_0167747294 /NCGR_PEP_ID=MMETSP0110_2-20121227/4203_1 /TAXON_ID=629695 /ORGANISM="Gymnochlora sp., Strain CCMP2014" /LENGTH=371 /DNA_ID=CAMNT_0007632183 /DNA_START=21 /DNA_END=1136 /DNA_ORIENTATION=-